MKQRKYQVLIFTILVGLIMLSCKTTQSSKKEDMNIDITSNKWEVVKIKKQEESTYINAKESYILEFINDKTFTLNLDVNNCGGHFEIVNNKNIIISELACTDACCDSDFAGNLVQLLLKMTEYYEKENELIFEGKGEIILKHH